MSLLKDRLFRYVDSAKSLARAELSVAAAEMFKSELDNITIEKHLMNAKEVLTKARTELEECKQLVENPTR